jgi:pyruvate/2-oxoglutarate/acetoin dehydrogenase E1 component
MTRPATDQEATEELSYREAINRALFEELRLDDDVLLLGENIGDFGGSFNVTAGLIDEFGPERVRETPISEAGFVGAGVGAAMTGLRPVLDVSFADFLGVPFEQLFNQASKMRYMLDGSVDVPIAIRSKEGAGQSGAAQHSKTPHAMFAHMTGLKVVAPGTPRAAKGLFKAAIRSNDPVLFFENKLLYEDHGEVPTSDDFTVPIGEARVAREGSDVTLVATQRLLRDALAVADDLAGEVDVEVVDPQSLYPLDTETIADSVAKTHRLVVADESPLSYGIHAEIVTRVVEEAFFSLDAPVERIGVPDTPLPYSPNLESAVLPDEDEIRGALRRTARWA